MVRKSFAHPFWLASLRTGSDKLGAVAVFTESPPSSILLSFVYVFPSVRTPLFRPVRTGQPVLTVRGQLTGAAYLFPPRGSQNQINVIRLNGGYVYPLSNPDSMFFCFVFLHDATGLDTINLNFDGAVFVLPHGHSCDLARSNFTLQYYVVWVLFISFLLQTVLSFPEPVSFL